MNRFVEEYDEITDNVRQFNLDLDKGTDVITQLSQFRHWYYIPELDYFGPSKFIGYKNTTTPKYNRGKGKDGRDTEVVLRKWFYELSENSKQWQKLFPRLEALLLQHGKKPNKNAKVHFPTASSHSTQPPAQRDMKITKDNILSKLKRFNLIYEFFGRAIQDRVEGNWFNNIIIRYLYRRPDALEKLNEILRIVNTKTVNADILSSKLHGADKKFDEKLLHLYAEILAARYFCEQGFERVEFMEETSDRLNPDIKLMYEGRTSFAEVKYLETTPDEFTPLLWKLEELETENLEIYGNKFFVIRIFSPSLAKIGAIKKDERDSKVAHLSQRLHDRVQENLHKIESIINGNQKYKFRIDGDISAEVEIKKSGRFAAALFHPQVHGTQLTTGTEFYHYGPTYAKVVGRIHSAYLQLLSNRDDDFELVRQDFVYLYIEHRGSDVLYEKEVYEKIQSILENIRMRNIVQVITSWDGTLKY